MSEKTSGESESQLMSSRRGDLSNLTMEKLIPISRNMKIDHEEVLQGFPGLVENKRKNPIDQ
jgi:hypothetical protein